MIYGRPAPARPALGNGQTEAMTRKASVVVGKDEHGFYAWCPELKGCQSQGDTLEEALANMREAIELYLETLPGAVNGLVVGL